MGQLASSLKTLCIMLLCLFNVEILNAKAADRVTAKFNALIDSTYKQNEPGGVVLVARKGEIIYERAFGMANLELNVPMQKDFVFCIASMTKQFTAVAILQQVERGTLSLQDSVGKFLPDYPSHLRAVTIGQLLTHTSGVPNAKSVGSLLAAGRGWLSAEQILAAFKDQPLDFTPGAKWAYSNSGYQLLGYILEKVTGRPYAEFMEETVLRTAGMDDSFYGNDMKIVPHRASSYLYTRHGIENAVNPNVQIAFAAGALQSTARDMFKWNRALLSGKLIKPETLHKAWSRAHLHDTTSIDYGFGWFVGELQGSPVVEHGGNMGGFMSHAMYLPNEDVLVVVLCNFRGKLPELLAAELAAMTIGKPLNYQPVQLSADALQAYTGLYRDLHKSTVTISLENGKLYYQKTGGPKWGLTPYMKDKFFFENTSTIGEMQRNADGSIARFAMQTRTGMSKNVITRMRADTVLTGKVICVDPGHGGTAQTDSFRVGRSGEREEWINLRVALSLKAMLEAGGATVVMTRNEDIAVPLKDRAVMAIDHKADVFLSIHHNATADSAVNFPIVYFHGNASENTAGVELGKCVTRSIAKFLFNNDTKVSLASDHTIFPEAGAAVLRHSYGIPGVLGEASFFTHADEDLRLKDPGYNKREAEAYYAALVEYFSQKRSEIKEKYSLVKVRPFPVYQEADRMSDTAKCWYAYYLKGKEKFKEGTPSALNEAYRLFSASAKSFPDSYVARECHYYLALLTERSDTAFSDDEKKRVREFYVISTGGGTFDGYYREAMDSYQKKEYHNSIDNFLKALELQPSNVNATYNLACVYALNGDKKQALSLLNSLVEKGLGLDAEHDGDFAALRDSEEFTRIVQKIQKFRLHVGESQQAFVVDEKDLIPEGITVDPVDTTFFIGSIYKAKIIRIDRNNTVQDFTSERQDGLWAVIGMKADPHRGVLWANSSAGNRTKAAKPEESGQTGVFKFDLKTGRLIKKYVLKDTSKTHFFNDLALAANGDVYITNSHTPAVYRIPHETDALELYLDLNTYTYPNGIAISDDNRHLYIAHSNGVLIADLKTKQYKAVAHPEGSSLNFIDGLYFYQNSLIGIQNFNFNRVARFYLNETSDEVTDVKVIEANHPGFNIPTTGVIVGNEFYFIANAQLGSFDAQDRIFPMDKLKEVIILKAKL